MTPERLTYKPPTPYAKDGGNLMVDAGTQEMAGMQNFNQALRASEKRAAEIAEAEKVAQIEAEKAAKEVAEVKMDKILQRQKREEEREKEKEEKEGKKAEGSAKKEGEVAKKENALKAKIEQIFSQVPSSVAHEAQSFRDVTGGKPLSEISNTKLITGYYIRLRGIAEEKGEDLNFLSEFKKELESRGVSTDGAYKASTEYYAQLLKKEHERLQREGTLSSESQAQKSLIENQLEKQGKVLERIKTDELRQEWYAEFTEKELKDPDTRSTIEAAIEKGYRPKSVTSKRAVKQVAEDVIRNALIEDKQTRDRAHELLRKDNLSGAEEIEILATHSERLNRAKIFLQVKELTKEQQMAIIKAHYEGKGGVYSYSTEDLLKKGRILAKVGFTKSQIETLIEAGIAATPIEVPGAIGNDRLRDIKAQIDAEAGRLGERREFSADYLEQQRRRIEGLVDQGTIPQADAEQARRFINSLNVRIDAAQQTQRQAREQEREAQRQEEVEERQVHLFVDPRDQIAQDFNPGQYEEQEVRNAANEIKTAIDGGTDMTRGEVDNKYLREKIDSLFERKQQLEEAGTPESEKTADKIGRLIGQLQDIKQALIAKETTVRLEKDPRSEGLYEDIRLSSGEKEELIQLALANNVEELERHFNQLFATADAHSEDDWRDAQGQAAELEVKSFARNLDIVASGRKAFKDSKREGIIRKLEKWEEERLKKVSRMLAEELKVRELMHNVTYYANRGLGIEDVHKLMKGFTGEDFDFAYNTKGVAAVGRLFEHAMLQVMAKHGGYLPKDTMVNNLDGTYGEVEQLVRDQIEIAQSLGELDLKPWEIDRAITLARGMGIVTGRTIELVASHGIPPIPGGSLVSWWANAIVKKVAFFRQLVRYDVGKQRNKLLAMKLEGQSRFWHTKELTEIGDLNTAEILRRFVNDNDDDRFFDMLNPFNVGSVWTQTQWRYQTDETYHTGAISHLLDGYMFNPIIGAGMWVEKRRRAWDENKKLSPKEIREAQLEFGENVSNQAELSKLLIERNLLLARNATPLKLFYNMTGLRQQVLRTYYKDSIEEKEGEKGSIVIKDQILQEDLKTLAAIQERLLRKRTDRYKEFAAGKIARPKLYEELASIEDEIRSLSTKLNEDDPNRTRRLLEFVDHVQKEFDKPNHKGRLMRNIKVKGWKVPFIFGTDDIPYDLYSIKATGDATDRRWGDIESAANAAGIFETKFLMNIQNFRDQESIIKVLAEFYEAMRGHDEGRTREFMKFITEAVIKFYKKDILARLPAGAGTLKDQLGGIIGKESSYARIAFKDPTQMAWDEITIDAFIKKMSGAGLIEINDINEIKKKTGATRWNLGLALTRTMIPLGILGFLLYMLSAELKNMKLA